MVHLEGLWYVSRGDGGQFDIDPLVHSVAFHVLVCLFLSRAYSRRYGDHMDSDPSPAPQTYYVERNLRIDEFARWAKGGRGGEGDPPGGNPNGASMRLRSVIGPPGGGKSMFLRQLHATLEIHSSPLFVFPVLSLKEVNDSELLWRWLEKATAKANSHGLGGPLPSMVVEVSQIGTVTASLCQACGANFSLVLVDALEEAPSTWQQEIEQFLIPLLNAYRNNTRVVLTRRDEYTLKEPILRWEEEVHLLKPLSSPAEQIRRRLETAGMMDADQQREPWDQKLDQKIVAAGLTSAKRTALLAELNPSLTPSPYINLLLLNCKLDHPAEPLDGEDYHVCLRQYVERANLTPTEAFATHLLDLGQDEEFFRNNGYVRKSPYRGEGSEPINSLLKSGTAANQGTDGYLIEPGVVALLRLCLNVAV